MPKHILKGYEQWPHHPDADLVELDENIEEMDPSSLAELNQEDFDELVKMEDQADKEGTKMLHQTNDDDDAGEDGDDDEAEDGDDDDA